MLEELNDKYLLIIKETFLSFLPININEIQWKRRILYSKDNFFNYEEQNNKIIIKIISICKKKILIINFVKTNVETDLIKEIINKINNYLKLVFDNDNNIDLKREIIKFAIDEAICKWVSGGQPVETNYKSTLNSLKKLSAITYEGEKITKIIGYKQEEKTTNGTISSFLNSKYIMPIANCNETAILVDSMSNKIIKYVHNKTKENIENSIIPLRYANISYTLFEEGAKIIFILTPLGEILIIKDKLLILKYFNGEWKYIRYNNFKTILHADGIKNDNINIIFNTVVDVSFSRTGGCLCILNDHKDFNLKSLFKPVDVLNENSFENITEKEEKKRESILSVLPFNDQKEYNFYELDRKMRLELLSLDGATVIKKDGTLIATGAIVTLKSIGDEGARTAATKELSKSGTSFKISEDGEITCYQNEINIFEM